MSLSNSDAMMILTLCLCPSHHNNYSGDVILCIILYSLQTKQVFSVVNTKVRTLKGITLKTASKIYVADNFELNNQFALDTRTFGSEVQSMNFVNSQKAADEVNAWVITLSLPSFNWINHSSSRYESPFNSSTQLFRKSTKWVKATLIA